MNDDARSTSPPPPPPPPALTYTCPRLLLQLLQLLLLGCSDGRFREMFKLTLLSER